ncbi:putative epidermal cell surface receptor isoform X1 [Lutzomyia longipalpis]|uniref:putative epidermal cell surface receptor isoform X1 n=1 Tax=Lutzomyia longipalpis TaxID=7200 RepID=UPI002483E95B|nr:putative epidermal cell surface receptor isoform X1 [Lutzomyia longipalpis]XP_055685901.1 putative epidermal cell surface receptor isoform X1 [Lutzomyia longipalpis]XP_055685911.1 putative epidermal cell surface receptor isoform X1 [Lutzomyia longipalpis]
MELKVLHLLAIATLMCQLVATQSNEANATQVSESVSDAISVVPLKVSAENTTSVGVDVNQKDDQKELESGGALDGTTESHSPTPKVDATSQSMGDSLATEESRKSTISPLFLPTTVVPSENDTEKTTESALIPVSHAQGTNPSTAVTPPAQEARGRAINFTSIDNGDSDAVRQTTPSPDMSSTVNPINYVTAATGAATRKPIIDLSDVSMDEEDNEEHSAPITSNVCMFEGQSFKLHDVSDRGCDERCICRDGGKWDCSPRCSGIFFKRGKVLDDPRCHEKGAADECCAVMVCPESMASDEEMEFKTEDAVNSPPSGGKCMYNGTEYGFGATIEEGCERVCKCHGTGQVTCEPRCHKMNETSSDQCVKVKDPTDLCCEIELCDVTLGDGEPHMGDKNMGDRPCEYKGQQYKLGDQFHDGCTALCICTDAGIHCAKLECPSSFGLDVINPHCLKWEPDPATFRAIAPKCCPERMRCVDNGTCEYQGQMFDNWSEIPANITGCDQHCYCERGTVECRPACPPVPALPPSHLPCHPRTARLMLMPDDDCCKQWACPSDPSNGIGHEGMIIAPTPPPTQKDGERDNKSQPFYPTSDGKAPKGVVQDKPGKKYTKEDNKTEKTQSHDPFAHLLGDHNKFDYVNYDEDIRQNQPGPGYFNPATVNKHHYPGQYPQNQGPPGHAEKPLPPELFNVLGQTGHNFGQHLTIEQILQHIQGADGGAEPLLHGQNVNVPYPYGADPHDHRLPSHRPVVVPPTGVPGGFPALQPNLQVLALDAIDSRTVRIIFIVPEVFVGLHGRVELRYTNGRSNDTATWTSQVFAPPEDLIATSQMEFELPGLEPNTEYKIKITLILRDLNAQPSSQIYTVRMPAERTITPPSNIDYHQSHISDVLKKASDPELRAVERNSTWLKLEWNKLSEDEIEYVDGIQLRYKEQSGMLYDATPLIHRTLTTHTIENLKPDTSYEVGLFLIPFPGHGAELLAGEMVKLATTTKIDMFAFEVVVNVTKVKASSVEVSWSGVPYPEDKFVNIYRAIYQSDAGKEDSSVFKVAKRDSTQGALIMDLKPGTRYRLWLEMYLTNGNIKKSNVVNFLTKPGGPATPGKTGKLLTSGDNTEPAGDYYGPLVVVAVVAALAVMSTLILLLILTRRRAHQTASITPPRKNDVSYDNPSYKVEIQQETMNL